MISNPDIDIIVSNLAEQSQQLISETLILILAS